MGCVQFRQPQEKAISAAGRDRSVQIEVLEAVLKATNRFGPAGGKPAATNGLQAEAALVKRPHFDRAGILWRQHRLEAGRDGFAERLFIVSLFLGAMDVALGAWPVIYSGPAYGPQCN